MFEAVLFDLDGTLLDTLADLADATNAALARQGFPVHAVDAYRWFVGDGVEELLRRALPRDRAGDEALVRRSIELQRQEYAARWSAKTRPYPGVHDLLDRLEERGLPMAILSNKPDPFVGDMVRHFFPGRRFAEVRGARRGGPRKPDPQAALEIAAALRTAAQRFLYVGDTNTDMRTARAAGMMPIGALWGFRTEEELRGAGAVHLIARPGDLLRLLNAVSA